MIAGFITYWQDKNKDMIKNLSSADSKNCIKHCPENDWETKTCMICYHNVDNAEMMSELKTKANEVEIHGQKLFASTENLLMPMVQFAFLFPMVLTVFFTKRNIAFPKI